MAETIRKHIKHIIYYLTFLGLYTESRDFFGTMYYWKYSVFVNVGVLGLFNVSQIMFVLTNLQDTTLLLTHAYLTLTFVMPHVKAYFYLKNWAMIRSLYDQLDEDVFQPTNRRQEEKVEALLRMVNWIRNVYNMMLVTIAAAFPLIPLLAKEERTLPFPAWLPYDYKRPILYQISYVHQCLGLPLMVLTNGTMDLIAFAFTSYIAVECDLLSDKLEHMYEFTEERLLRSGTLSGNEGSEEKYGVVIENMHESLVEMVSLHRKILKFADDTNSFFNILIFSQFGSSLLSICLVLYGITVITSPAELVIAAVFQAGILVELSYYCFFGNEVIAKSQDILSSLYQMPWVDCSKKFKDDLLFFMLRVQRPIKLLALGFFEVSLPTFIWILRCSMSVFTVLNETKEPKNVKP